MVKPKVKILLAYFKPTYLFKNDLLIPVHAGRAVRVPGRFFDAGTD